MLKSHPEIAHVQVEGHTDNVGKEDTNRKLSQARAESVRNFLVMHGVGPGRLTARGFGPERPIDTNRTDAGRANNRRVEFTVESPEGAAEPAP